MSMPNQQSVQGKLGTKLRELRIAHNLSIRTLATRTGFSPSFISQIELEAVSPSLASLEKIAAELGVTLAQLFSSLESSPRLVIRRDERPIYQSTWSRSTVTALTDMATGRKLSAVLVAFEPGGAGGRRPVASHYDSFALVLAGEVRLVLEDSHINLTEGDAVYLAEETAHVWQNQSSQHATLLIVRGTGPAAVLSDLLVEQGDEATCP
jgi:transcriptional regulator with XRE-family HTH domain